MSGPSTFRVGNHAYEARALSAFDQWELARLARDVLSGLALLKKAAAEAVEEAKKSKTHIQEITPNHYVRAMAGLAGSLTREESRAVLQIAMSCVYRQDGQSWQKVQTPSAELMYADITMPQQIEIVYHVLERHDLIDFFSVSPSASAAEEGQGTGHVSRAAKTSS